MPTDDGSVVWLVLGAGLLASIWLIRYLSTTPTTEPTVNLRFSNPLPRHTTQGALGQAYLSATVQSATPGFWGLQPSTVAGLQLQHINDPDFKRLMTRAFPPEIADHPIVLGAELVTVENGLMYMVRPRFRFEGDKAVGVELSLRSVISTRSQLVH